MTASASSSGSDDERGAIQGWESYRYKSEKPSSSTFYIHLYCQRDTGTLMGL